jgi:D-beta-D-heptose 7-phosphate kinase/D-beta-D-heptose 1-phosphate adenosyltransferase
LRQLLEDCEIDTSSVLEDEAFPTIVKTRIIARQQQVVRVDREQIRTPRANHVAEVAERFAALLPETDGVVFEDYGKGFLSAELVNQLTEMASAAAKVVTVDPNPRHPLAWKKATAVKPNRSEAFLAAGVPWSDPVDPASEDRVLRHVGQRLLEKWDTKFLLITLGEQGMMLFEGDDAWHIPTKAQQVFDVSGAGDTAIALFTLALCAEATAREAADIANHASAVVVGKLGTATLTRQELIASFDDDFAA